MPGADPTGKKVLSDSLRHMQFTDQTGHTFELKNHPKNIISLVPSQTELLYDLGLENEVKGITKFCIHPSHWRKEKTIVGGTKKIRMETIQSLHPDLIIANKEENTKEEIEFLRLHYPVYTSDINNLEEALEMISDIGIITGKSKESKILIEEVSSSFAQLRSNSKYSNHLDNISTKDKRVKENKGKNLPGKEIQKPINSLENTPPIRIAYLIWREPFMAAGSQTFIHSMIEACGWKNAFEKIPRYPEVHLNSGNKTQEGIEEKIVKKGRPDLSLADIVFLSSEPYPFAQKHIDEIQTKLPGKIVLLVDGEMFSWYGSRLLKSVAYFTELKDQIHILIAR